MEEAKDGQYIGVLLDLTSFYSEQGGQVCDEGFITKYGEEVSTNLLLQNVSFLLPHFLQDVQLLVRGVQVGGGYVLHTGVLNGSLKVGDRVTLHIDVVSDPPH